MKQIGVVYLIIFLLLGIVSCNQTAVSFKENQIYTGFWAESQWTYNFKTNGTYILEYGGHVGDGSKGGAYVLKDSIVVLLANSEHFENWRFNRFKIGSQGCLRDYVGYFYCESEEQLTEVSERRFREQEILREGMEELDFVKNERLQLLSQDSTINYRLRDKGIVVINGREYYEYRLESWMPEIRRYRVHLRLYAKYDPIRIFDEEFNMIKEVQVSDH